MAKEIKLNVNGKAHTLRVEPRRLLLDMLRDDLSITGPKEGCGVGVCGACTVLIDGRLTSACLELAIRCDDTEILTIEGLAGDDGLHPIQQAFIDAGGFQCGICTPGMILTTKALLDRNPDPTDGEIERWMMGNLCRCTGYYKIAESVRAAAQALAGETAEKTAEKTAEESAENAS